MTPETNTSEEEREEEPRLQEESRLYVEDHSRAAQDVLQDQRQKRAEDDVPALFVP